MNKINLDKFLVGILVLILIGHYAGFLPLGLDQVLLIFFASFAVFPVLISAFQSLKNKKITIDLLASVALAVSIFNKAWASRFYQFDAGFGQSFGHLRGKQISRSD